MVRDLRSSSNLKSILAAKDYRSLLKCLVAESENSTNFSDLSRRAGFSSRSYIREVMTGKKRLTATSLAKFKKAFRLSGSLAMYFETLVALEEPNVNIAGLSKEVLLTRLEKIRLSLSRQKNADHSNKNNLRTDQIFQNRYVPIVYASLGSIERGASVPEIQSRCGLGLEIIQPILDHFKQHGLIENKEGRLFVKDSELDIFGLGNDINFLNVYRDVISNLKLKVQKGLNSKNELFMYSAFTVKSDRLPDLRGKLKAVLLEFLDQEQVDDGDKVAQLILGFHI